MPRCARLWNTCSSIFLHRRCYSFCTLKVSLTFLWRKGALLIVTCAITLSVYSSFHVQLHKYLSNWCVIALMWDVLDHPLFCLFLMREFLFLTHSSWHGPEVPKTPFFSICIVLFTFWTVLVENFPFSHERSYCIFSSSLLILFQYFFISHSCLTVVQSPLFSFALSSIQLL